MKFITEMELRAVYKTEPFATYVLESDAKITPGARQFLIDRRVTLVDAQPADGKKTNTGESKQAQGQENWSILRLRGRMDFIESLVLLIAAELLHLRETVLSAEIIALGTCFQTVRNAEREQLAPDNLQFWECSAAEITEQANELEKQVDISRFQLGLDNGKELALLNHLRASFRELEPAILEAYWDEEQHICSRQDLIETVNLIINILCIMMWKCQGGKTWKR